MIAFAKPDNVLGFARILLSSQSNEWYTPASYVEAAREVMGGIDLDPASCELANRTVKATTYYTKEQNGLSQEWKGRVWINPPWGGRVGTFVKRLLWEYEQKNVSQAVLFTNAVTDRKWFQPLWDYPICFTDGRVYCYAPGDKIGDRPTGGVWFTYLGKHEQSFIRVLSQFCTIFTRASPPDQTLQPLTF